MSMAAAPRKVLTHKMLEQLMHVCTESMCDKPKEEDMQSVQEGRVRIECDLA